MNGLQKFIGNNYILWLVGAGIFILALIGFYIDKKYPVKIKKKEKEISQEELEKRLKENENKSLGQMIQDQDKIKENQEKVETLSGLEEKKEEVEK